MLMKTKKTQTLPVARFRTLSSKEPHPATWAQLYEEIQNTSHINNTRAYRHALQQLEEAEEKGDMHTADAFKKQKGSIKLGQPAFLCAADVQGGRSLAHVTVYTGFYMMDFDGVDPGQMADAVARLRADKHTFLSHITLSGRGIRVIARGAVCKDQTEFVRC